MVTMAQDHGGHLEMKNGRHCELCLLSLLCNFFIEWFIYLLGAINLLLPMWKGHTFLVLKISPLGGSFWGQYPDDDECFLKKKPVWKFLRDHY